MFDLRKAGRERLPTSTAPSPQTALQSGVAPLADNRHPLLGRQRFNLTLRKAG